ncbi:MAG: DnaA/Hda family protein [Candidatus Eisenbacteria bacterium]|jgi:chromosomal replication initiation ATPase DnaA|nr:DnaA/Hda family protein [Candidatus Eisenbacteria bacterium]
MKQERKRLGTMLVEERVITEHQLKEALHHQRRTGQILGNTLVELGFVEESILLPLLARHYARLQPTLADCKISADIVGLIPSSMAHQYQAMPIGASFDQVTVAFANPMNDRAVQAISAFLRRRVRPVLCPRDTLSRAISLHYGAEVAFAPEVTAAMPVFPQPPPNLSFETFVVGDANRTTYLAAEEAAEYPGTARNPLLIYGEVGHGKTHLLCAIGNRALARDPSRCLAWLPATEVEHELTEAIETKSVEQFHSRYQRADLLLLDDIQFLARHRGVQQEFAKLFRLLCAQGKQVAATSDRPLEELDVLLDEIRSQFSTGATVHVGTASVALKTAIIMAKQKASEARLPDALIGELARELPDDIRYLEGTLRNLSLRLAISGEKPTIDAIRRHLTLMRT